MQPAPPHITTPGEPAVQQSPAHSPIKEAILRRVKVLYVLFFLLGLTILGRIIWLQVGSDSAALRHRGVQYSYRREILDGTRGNIYSDDGRLMATSIPYYELRMDMDAGGLTQELFTTGIDSLSLSLAHFFRDKSAAEYKKELTQARTEKKRYHLVTRRKINFLELQTVKNFPLFRLGPNKGGFLHIETNRRINPHGELAQRTLGFVNQSGVKLGIEGGFDDYLKGQPGATVKQKVSGNFWAPIAHPDNFDPIDGYDVVSTLNIEMQDMIQNALREWIVQSEADWGCVAVMDVQTGDIKALSNITRKSDGNIVEDYNYAIGMSMEPGSTFKLAGLLALLDDAHMPLSTPINTGNGVAQIGPVKIVDSHAGGFGTVSLQQVFEKSSNIGMARAVNQAYGSNPAKFVNAINKLGLHKPLNLQLAGEARPLIKHPAMKNGWDGTTMTMMSYGYALRLAPIHTLTLYNAVANNGIMVKPIFVRELKQHDKTLIHYPTDTLNRAICTPQTLRGVQRSLEGVVTSGTGKLLLNPRYRIAAKTGTAQVAIGRSGYLSSTGGRHYLGSMVGYLPAGQPKYTLIAALKTYHPEGSKKPYYGTALAGPLFKTIADRIYALYYNYTNKVIPKAQPYDPQLTTLPGPTGSLSQLMKDLNIVGAPRLPSQGTAALDSGGRIIIPAPMPVTAGVPDLKGLTLEEALQLTETVGLQPRFTGLGRVTTQTLEAGTPFEQGTEILITLGRK